MTLTETLQIKERYLKYEDMRALDYIEKRWQEGGCPIERWQLINFLELMLRELKAHGTGYPKVILLRKKEIQRKTFAVEKQDDSAQAAARSDAPSFKHPNIRAEWIRQSEENRRRELLAGGGKSK